MFFDLLDIKKASSPFRLDTFSNETLLLNTYGMAMKLDPFFHNSPASTLD